MTACSCAGWRRRRSSSNSAASSSAATPSRPAGAAQRRVWQPQPVRPYRRRHQRQQQLSHRPRPGCTPRPRPRTPRRPAARTTSSTARRPLIFDAVYKWAPGGNPVDTNFMLQGEFFADHDDGQFDSLPTMPAGRPAGMPRRSTSSCRAGGSGCATTSSTATTQPDCWPAARSTAMGITPRAASAMIEYDTSEFGRFRAAIQPRLVARHARRPSDPAIHHQPRPARRAPLLGSRHDPLNDLARPVGCWPSSRCLLRARPRAALQVFACEPEWGALASEIGGDKVNVFAATTGVRTRTRSRPARRLIAKARTADLVGLHRRRTGDRLAADDPAPGRQRPIAAGRPGLFRGDQLCAPAGEADPARPRRGRHPRRRQPAHPDRPAQHAPVGKALADRFAELDPANAAAYRAREPDLRDRWAAAMQRWQQQAAPLRGMTIAVAITRAGSIWRTGLACARRRARAQARRAAEQPVPRPTRRANCRPASVRGVIYAAYEDPRALGIRRRSASASPAIMLPFTVGGTDQAKDLFGLFDDTINRLVQGLRRRSAGARRRALHPAAGLPRRAVGAGDPCAARPAGAGPRHRLHRPGHRAGGGPRRHRRRRDGLGAAGLVGADQRRRGGPAERRLAVVERATLRGVAGGADRRPVRGRRLRRD